MSAQYPERDGRNARITVLVNRQPFELLEAEVSPQDLRDLIHAPADYEVWQVVKSPDPEGQLPVDDVQVIDVILAKSGDRFRIVPPGTFGAAPTLTRDALDDAIDMLSASGFSVTRGSHGSQHAIYIADYRLPAGWSQPTTRLLLLLPRSFPFGKPDMFWVEAQVTLQGGAIPHQAHVIQEIDGYRWRRFSWHLASWHPAKDNILTFLAFVDRRLHQVH